MDLEIAGQGVRQPAINQGKKEMTLNQLIKQLSQIVAENPQAGDLPVHETYYVSRGDCNAGYEAYHEVKKILVGEAEVFVKQRKGHYLPEMKPAVLLKFNED
jgi:hypothetical protein